MKWQLLKTMRLSDWKDLSFGRFVAEDEEEETGEWEMQLTNVKDDTFVVAAIPPDARKEIIEALQAMDDEAADGLRELKGESDAEANDDGR